jgi:hypothetical protein
VTGSKARLFLAGFLGLFLTATLGLDALVAHSLITQARSTRFAKTTGTITKSELDSHRRRGGRRSYALDLAYTYSVQGRVYTGTRQHFGLPFFGDRSAKMGASAYPVGKTVTVHYDQADPSVATLETGVREGSLVMLIFVAPFNFFLLGLGGAVLWSYRPIRSERGVGGLKVIEDPDTIRVRLPRTPAPVAALLAMTLASLAALFVVLFVLNAKISAQRLSLVTQIVLGIGLAALVLKALANRSATGDLIVAPLRRELRFRWKGKTRELRFEQVEAVESKAAPGALVHHVDIRWRDADGDERVTHIAQLNRAEQAAALAAWLRETIGLKATVDV